MFVMGPKAKSFFCFLVLSFGTTMFVMDLKESKRYLPITSMGLESVLLKALAFFYFNLINNPNPELIYN